MKITRKSPKETSFGKLLPGDVFKMPDVDSPVPFLKLAYNLRDGDGDDNDEQVHAVSLDDGTPITFTNDESVVLLSNAELRI